MRPKNVLPLLLVALFLSFPATAAEEAEAEGTECRTPWHEPERDDGSHDEGNETPPDEGNKTPAEEGDEPPEEGEGRDEPPEEGDGTDDPAQEPAPEPTDDGAGYSCGSFGDLERGMGDARVCDPVLITSLDPYPTLQPPLGILVIDPDGCIRRLIETPSEVVVADPAALLAGAL